MAKLALVAGPTGLIGRLLLERLLAHPGYREVRAISRRELPAHPNLRTLISDYADVAAAGAALAADDVFCCLGTTLARAGSRAAFEDVDYRMVVDFARAAQAQGARRFIVVSAAGTAERSLSFYSRVKARMEKAVAALPFQAVHILRPSLLLGAREEHRPAEDLSQKLAPLVAPLFRGPLLRYRPVRGEDVADAMIALAQREVRGVFVHHLPLAS